MEDANFVVSYFKFLKFTNFNENALPHFFKTINEKTFLDRCSMKVSCQRIKIEFNQHKLGEDNETS